MVQYAAELNDNTSKFAFPVTYQYMKFCLKKQIKPSTPWNVIDNHLWSKCFSGAAKDSSFHANSQQEGAIFLSQRTCHDFNFRSCTRAKCKFQHKCSKCYQSGHTQHQCHVASSNNTTSSSFTTSRTNIQTSHPHQVPSA